jgi:NAD(P)-dependent dehydrogenase (short-subunit alcohol dehydrogenase family)
MSRPDDVRRVLETNGVGIVHVAQLLPLLERSVNPVIVNVSRGMGSLVRTTDPARVESKITMLGYPTSTAAVNMLTSQYAKAFPAMRINAVDSGHTATDFNGHRSTQTVDEGAEGDRRHRSTRRLRPPRNVRRARRACALLSPFAPPAGSRPRQRRSSCSPVAWAATTGSCSR